MSKKINLNSVATCLHAAAGMYWLDAAG